MFIGRTDAKAEAPLLWPPDAKSQLTGKDLMLGKIEGRGRRGRQRIRWLGDIADLMDMKKLDNYYPIIIPKSSKIPPLNIL